MVYRITMVSNPNTSASINTQNTNASAQEKLLASRTVVAAQSKERLNNLFGVLDKKESTNGTSKFLRILDGENKVILFDPDKVEHTEITYPSKNGEPESKPVNRVKFIVKEANEDGVVPDGTIEQELTMSETTGKNIIKWILKGFVLLDIKREGSSKFDTKYDIAPHL